jgi:hypothetical protein
MGNCYAFLNKKNSVLDEPLIPMSQVIGTVNELKEKNSGLNQRIRSIESTLSNSQGEMQIKINQIVGELNKITNNVLPNLLRSKGDVLELKEKVINMSTEVRTIGSEIEHMKDNTLLSSQLDPIKNKMESISNLDSQVRELKSQIEQISKVTTSIETRDNWMKDN